MILTQGRPNDNTTSHEDQESTMGDERIKLCVGAQQEAAHQKRH